MPWWVETIFVALVVAFGAGLALGLSGIRSLGRRSSGEVDRRRLEAEAESDRLRLQISALKAGEERATEVEREFAVFRRKAANSLLRLEKEYHEAHARAEAATRLAAAASTAPGDAGPDTPDVAALRHQAGRVEGLEAELVGLREAAERADAAAAGLDGAQRERDEARAEATRLALELATALAGRADIEERADWVEELEAEIDRLTDRLAGMERIEAELEAARVDAEASLELRSRIQELEAELVTVGAGTRQVNGVRSDPDQTRAAGTEVERLTVDVDRLTVDLRTNREPSSGEATPVGADPAAVVPVPVEDDPGAGPCVAPVDDLQAIRGIGPKIERLLNDLGIRSWEQVAAFSADDIAAVSEALRIFPGRIERDDWVGGARALLDGRSDPAGDAQRA